MKASLPFSGFYESQWDAMLDDAAEQILDYLLGENDSGPYPDDEPRPFHGGDRAALASALHWVIDWRRAHAYIAKEYAERFALASGIACKFEALWSPREYNFQTDAVDVILSRATVRALRRKLNTERMDQIAAERHTSRSGFHSFYSPDWRTWGSVDKWNEVQVSTLILASVENAREIEEDIQEQMQCNGEADNALSYDAAELLTHYQKELAR